MVTLLCKEIKREQKETKKKLKNLAFSIIFRTFVVN